jgi:hypothetical protein
MTQKADELEKAGYNFVQDVIFWYGNTRSPHYKVTDYGSSFNTDAFCKEFAQKYKLAISTREKEAKDNGLLEALFLLDDKIGKKAISDRLKELQED